MNQHEASSLVIRNLKLLEEVSAHLSETMDEIFCSAINELVEEIINNWTDESGRCWDLTADLYNEDIKFSPKKWRINESDSEKFIASYNVEFMKDAKTIDWNDEAEYFISSFIGASTLQVGFKMNINNAFLSSAKQSTFRKFTNEHSSNVLLKSAKFIPLNDGSWFLPFTIDTDTLADAFANEAIKDALDPIKNALATIIEMQPVFEKLVNDSIEAFGLKN